MTSYLTGLSHGFKSRFLPDHTQNYLVRKLIVGAKKLGDSNNDGRLPITKGLLVQMIKVLPLCVDSCYDLALAQCLFVWCYAVALRVSEVAYSKKCEHALKVGQVTPLWEHGQLVAYKIQFERGR